MNAAALDHDQMSAYGHAAAVAFGERRRQAPARVVIRGWGASSLNSGRRRQGVGRFFPHAGAILQFEALTRAGLDEDVAASIVAIDPNSADRLPRELPDPPPSHRSISSACTRYVEKHSEGGGQKIGNSGQVGDA